MTTGSVTLSPVEPMVPVAGRASTTDTEASPKQVWVEIMTTQEVVAVGLRTILENAEGHLSISTKGPLDARLDAEPDVVLYDVIKLHNDDGGELDQLLRQTASCIIAVDRTLSPVLGRRARDRGVEWRVTLNITGDQLVTLIHDAVAGELDESAVAEVWDTDEHLGEAAGLSPREGSVLGLVVAGLSNQQIADRLYLSINSVKTYIRSTYRKVGVSSRAQAVAWGIQHGFPVSDEV
jgi:DNA-binding NarL/FixJ family response regulator